MLYCAARNRAAVLEALVAAHPDAADFAIGSGDRNPRFVSSALQLQDLAIRRTSTSGYRCVVRPTDAIRLALPVRGGVTLAFGGEKAVGRAGVTGLVCCDRQVVRDVLADYVGYHVQVSRALLVRQAQLLVDGGGGVDRVSPIIDLRSPVGAALCRNVTTFFSEAEQLAPVGLGPLICATGADLLLNLTVLALLPDIRERFAEPTKHIGRGLAERARNYLEEHAADPVRLSSLAAELGISLRSLQLGFRKEFDCTPSEYLFACRLRRAREHLLASSGATTVARIAVDCGFTNAGNFAARYRVAYGELPSETLRRKRS